MFTLGGHTSRGSSRPHVSLFFKNDRNCYFQVMHKTHAYGELLLSPVKFPGRYKKTNTSRAVKSPKRQHILKVWSTSGSVKTRSGSTMEPLQRRSAESRETKDPPLAEGGSSPSTVTITKTGNEERGNSAIRLISQTSQIVNSFSFFFVFPIRFETQSRHHARSQFTAFIFTQILLPDYFVTNDSIKSICVSLGKCAL